MQAINVRWMAPFLGGFNYGAVPVQFTSHETGTCQREMHRKLNRRGLENKLLLVNHEIRDTETISSPGQIMEQKKKSFNCSSCI